jgi:acyl carrier protein
MLNVSAESTRKTVKFDRIRECLIRAGLPHVPAGEQEELAAYGFDSLLAVLAVIELQKEFGIVIPSQTIGPGSFRTLRALSRLLPEPS